MKGIDAVKEKYIRNPNRAGKAWFVPQKDLIKFKDEEINLMIAASPEEDFGF